MLIIELKPKEEIEKLLDGKILSIECLGCREIQYPEKEVEIMIQSLREKNFQHFQFDYLCNEKFTKERIEKNKKIFDSIDKIVVFSCGVGTQTLSTLVDKPVYTCTNTIYIKGFQGLQASKWDCLGCENCVLNFTGGICPLTSCSKGLLNGPCGGSKNGKCEVDPDLDCGWVLINERLKKYKKFDEIKTYLKERSFK